MRFRTSTSAQARVCIRGYTYKPTNICPRARVLYLLVFTLQNTDSATLLVLFERTSSADPNGLHSSHEVLFTDHAVGFHSACKLLLEQQI